MNRMAENAPEIERYLRRCIEQHIFPSAVYLAGRGETVLATGAIGKAVVDPESIPASTSTIYDLASLTKPLVTALLAAQLIEAGKFDLETPASHYLSEFLQTGKGSITIGQLLAHTSGLPAWLPLQGLGGVPSSALQTISLAATHSTPGEHVVYSDLGYIALGVLLERVTQQQLGALAQEKIFSRLALSRTFFSPDLPMRRQIAATEEGNDYEVRKAAESGVTLAASRKGVLWGEVHDGNAWFLGGAAGHAGLFSTAGETFRLARQFLRGSLLLREQSLPLFTKSLTRELEEERSAGWQLATSPNCSAGPSLSPASFGHTGFTGTSLWIDPGRDAVFVLLTNRVHPRVREVNMNAVRRQFHTLAVQELFDASF